MEKESSEVGSRSGFGGGARARDRKAGRRWAGEEEEGRGSLAVRARMGRRDRENMIGARLNEGRWLEGLGK